MEKAKKSTKVYSERANARWTMMRDNVTFK
jgi:hypothetical protein